MATSPLTRIIAEADQQLRNLEDEHIKVVDAGLRLALDNLNRELSKVYDESLGQVQSEKTKSLRIRRAKALAARLNAHLAAFDGAAAAGDVKGGVPKATASLIYGSHGMGIKQSVAELKAMSYLNPLVIQPNFAAVDAAAKGMRSRLTKHSDAFIKQAEKHVISGLVTGKGMARTSRNLRIESGELRSKVERVVRTETLNAMDKAKRDGFKKNGIQYVQRTAANDLRVCGYCASRHGQIYPIDQAPAALHPYDRCTNLPFRPEWVEDGLVDLDQYAKERKSLQDKLKDAGHPLHTALDPAPFEASKSKKPPTPLSYDNLKAGKGKQTISPIGGVESGPAPVPSKAPPVAPVAPIAPSPVSPIEQLADKTASAASPATTEFMDFDGNAKVAYQKAAALFPDFHLTDDQRDALEMYVGGESAAINLYLRDRHEFLKQFAGTPITEAMMQQRVPVMDSILSTGYAPVDMLLYRAIDPKALAGLKEGETWTDLGYGSNALDRNNTTGFGGLHMTIKVPKATRALLVDKALDPTKPGDYENEVLLERGLTYRIDKIDGNEVELSIVTASAVVAPTVPTPTVPMNTAGNLAFKSGASPGMPVEVDGVLFQPYTDAQKGALYSSLDKKLPTHESPMVVPPGKKAGAGVVIVTEDGRVWLVEPTNHFGGYLNTWPKGKQEPGMTLQQTALKEAMEETGLAVDLVDVLGDFETSTSMTRYYVAKVIGGAPWDAKFETSLGFHETANVKLVDQAEAAKILNKSWDKDILTKLGEKQTGTVMGAVVAATPPAVVPPKTTKDLPTPSTKKPLPVPFLDLKKTLDDYVAAGQKDVASQVAQGAIDDYDLTPEQMEAMEEFVNQSSPPPTPQQPVEWKPVLTPDEAARWAAGSVEPGPMFSVLPSAKLAKAKEDGLPIGTKSTAKPAPNDVGHVQGVAMFKTEAEAKAHAPGQVFEVRANVQRVLDLAPSSSASTANKPLDQVKAEVMAQVIMLEATDFNARQDFLKRTFYHPDAPVGWTTINDLWWGSTTITSRLEIMDAFNTAGKSKGSGYENALAEAYRLMGYDAVRQNGVLRVIHQEKVVIADNAAAPAPAKAPVVRKTASGIKANTNAPGATKYSDFPMDIDRLRVVSQLGGSTGAQLVEDPATGKRFVLKRGSSAGHLQEEMRADHIYANLGIPIARFQRYDTAAGPVKLAEFIPGRTLDRLRGDERATVVREAKKHMAADALLGNWDVAGMSNDNLMLGDDGKVYRIDNGGALRYRAQGKLKGTDKTPEFTEFPADLWSIRNPKINRQAASLFDGLSWSDITDQLEALSDSGENVLAGIDDAALRSTLEKRLARMGDLALQSRAMLDDKWDDKHVDDMARHRTDLQAEGISGRLPKKLLGSGSVLRDEGGKAFDDLRTDKFRITTGDIKKDAPHNSIMYHFEEWLGKRGLKIDILRDMASGQAGTSWSRDAQATKVALVRHRSKVPIDSYYWQDGHDQARYYYDALLARHGLTEEQFDELLSAWKAFQYEFLVNTDLPNKNTKDRTVTLKRTENRDLMRRYGLKRGDKKVKMMRGAAESTSLVKSVKIKGSELTVQRVPYHRVVFNYLIERYFGYTGGALLNDRENEFVAMLEDLPFDYR